MSTNPPPRPLSEYTHIISSFSSGKDSSASVVALIEAGADPAVVELWHQGVDGEPGGPVWADWPCTESFVRRFGEAFGFPAYFQWKEGGFKGELLRDNVPTAGVGYEATTGDRVRLPASKQAKPGTRLRFPQVSGDLRVRWCSAYLKIDVAARVLNNDPRFKGATVLYVTGERGEESSARAKYNESEPHRCHSGVKTVDAWRPVLRWTEAEVWDAMRRHGMRPHPAYYLGFNRVSCRTCIFGLDDQWRTVHELAPDLLQEFVDLEKQSGLTIHRTKSIPERVAAGKSTIPPGRARDVEWSNSTDLPLEAVKVPPEEWELPAGAYKRCGGPT